MNHPTIVQQYVTFTSNLQLNNIQDKGTLKCALYQQKSKLKRLFVYKYKYLALEKNIDEN